MGSRGGVTWPKDWANAQTRDASLAGAPGSLAATGLSIVTRDAVTVATPWQRGFVGGHRSGVVSVHSESGHVTRARNGHRSRVTAICGLSDGRFVSAGRDGCVRIWDSDGNPSAPHAAHERGVLALCALSDGRFVSAGRDGSVRIWDSEGNPSARHAAHEHEVLALCALSDGRFVSAGGDGSVRIWDSDGAILFSTILTASGVSLGVALRDELTITLRRATTWTTTSGSTPRPADPALHQLVRFFGRSTTRPDATPGAENPTDARYVDIPIHATPELHGNVWRFSEDRQTLHIQWPPPDMPQPQKHEERLRFLATLGITDAMLPAEGPGGIGAQTGAWEAFEEAAKAAHSSRHARAQATRAEIRAAVFEQKPVIRAEVNKTREKISKQTDELPGVGISTSGSRPPAASRSGVHVDALDLNMLAAFSVSFSMPDSASETVYFSVEYGYNHEQQLGSVVAYISTGTSRAGRQSDGEMPFSESFSVESADQAAQIVNFLETVAWEEAMLAAMQSKLDRINTPD